MQETLKKLPKGTGGFDTGKEVWQMSEIFTMGNPW